jgi:glycosyltransferase involved in cell wall biosynthesis
MKKHVVFATYNGLLDPLGPSQILPYLERLHPTWPVHILSFERPDRLGDAPALAAMEKRLSSQAIGWTRLRYHKWPSLPATTFDLAVGVLAMRRIIRRARGRVGLVHLRGYLPMAIASRATRKLPLLFDIRGLQAEEYVDGGVWKEGELKWRLAKASEREFFRRAAGAVVLTENIRPYVEEQFRRVGRTPPVAVIPCCVDLTRFRFDGGARAARRQELRVPESTTLFVYSGTIGTWYMPAEMARFVRVFKRVTARPVCLLWMVNNEERRVQELSRAAGLADDEYRVRRATADQVPGYLSASDAALALIRPCFSKRSSSPTKYAECLAMGLPILICRGVGDGAVLADRGAAVATDEQFDEPAMEAASIELARLLSKPRDHFRGIATEVFDIERVALPAYRAMYERLSH